MPPSTDELIARFREHVEALKRMRDLTSFGQGLGVRIRDTDVLMADLCDAVLALARLDAAERQAKDLREALTETRADLIAICTEYSVGHAVFPSLKKSRAALKASSQ